MTTYIVQGDELFSIPDNPALLKNEKHIYSIAKRILLTKMPKASDFKSKLKLTNRDDWVKNQLLEFEHLDPMVWK